MPLTIPLAQAERVRTTYLCSDCWEALVEIQFDRQTRSVTLACNTPDCPHRGMVSVQYVEQRERLARIWVRNIRKQLANELTWVKPIPKRTQSQLLVELGYY
ncbi:MAG: hypothetical protein H8E29_02435 [Anaerolineales bacterium]|uniref:Uncharacterized protein n=1 Tax=Candidatus Desulfolinea nitratireducens TaxID=2841698 RepID=A0A8J6NHX1_9CHLR|nr:hypothetical protein [Candidatus Desulfolinea nitratireducens]